MSFWKEAYHSFLRCYGYVLMLVSIFITLGVFYFGPETTIKMKVLVPIICVIFMLMAILVDLSRFLIQEKRKLLPRVLEARTPQAIWVQIYNGAIAWLLLDGSPLFAHESLVSIFNKDGKFEILMGIGFILAVQENGLIQVIVTNSVSEQDGFWERVCGNDSNILKTLIIKPSIPRLLQ